MTTARGNFFGDVATLFRDVPHFSRLWAGRATSTIGDSTQLVAVLWMVSAGPASGLGAGLVAFTSLLPTVVLAPFAGALIDRLPRRVLLICCDLGRGAGAALIPFAYGHFELLGLLLLIVFDSVLSTVFSSAYLAAYPELIGRERVLVGNSVQITTNNISSVVGAGLGGLLMSRGYLPLPFSINALTFLISAVAIASLPNEGFDIKGAAEREPYLSALSSGFTYIRESKAVQLLLAAGFIATVGFSPAIVALVVLSQKQLGGGSAGYGMLQALTTVGLALGAIVAGQLGRSVSKTTLVWSAYVLMGAATAVLGTAHTVAAAGLIVVVRSGLNSVSSIAGLSLIQSIVPNEYRGRVFTALAAAQETPRLFILPTAGALIDSIGVGAVYLLMAFFIALAGVIVAFGGQCLSSAEPAAVTRAGV